MYTYKFKNINYTNYQNFKYENILSVYASVFVVSKYKCNSRHNI